MPAVQTAHRPAHAALATVAVATIMLAAACRPALAREDLSRLLGFESPEVMARLHPELPETVSLDSSVVHGGRYSLRIQRDSTSHNRYSVALLRVPVDFKCDTIELRGWIRWRGVDGYAGLVQRQDGPDGLLTFDDMHARHLQGDSGWVELTSRLPYTPGVNRIHVGAILSGSGTLWVDDLRVFLDGVPLAQADVVDLPQQPRTPLDTDHMFDAGSGFTFERVSAAQADNLALLGRVWGFLKYHHPAVVNGRRHWDYDLFRILPAVGAARTAAECRRVLVAWIDSLPPVPVPDTLTTLPPDSLLALAPDLAWLGDPSVVGDTLGARLRLIHERRPNVKGQFFAYPARKGGFATFSRELDYASLRTPDAGFRLLALFRYWNVMEYWHPDRALIGDDWAGVLREFVPRALAARTHDDYARCMLALSTRMHDGHQGPWNVLDAQPPHGGAYAPVNVRFVEGRAVVIGWSHPTLGPATGLRVGDVIRRIDGVPVDTLLARWRPFYPTSNEATFLRDVSPALTRGDSGDVRLAIERDGRTHELRAPRVRFDRLPGQGGMWEHDLPGLPCRRASEALAYLAVFTASVDSLDLYLARIAGAKCLVLDLRNYPETAFAPRFGSHLVKVPTAFARYSLQNYANPGAFEFTPCTTLRPVAPAFEGRVEILVDETSQSAAEFLALKFRACPHARVVGSTTAGADGNVVTLTLPGGVSTQFSSIGVYTPDRKNTQRVGIEPDLDVRPTIAGIIAGRDEVLEAAARDGLGRDLTSSEREALKPQRDPETAR